MSNTFSGVNPMINPPKKKEEKIFTDFKQLLVDYNITFKHLLTVKQNRMEIILLEKNKPTSYFGGTFTKTPPKIVVTFMNSGTNDLFYINYDKVQNAIGQIQIKGKIDDIPTENLAKIASDERYAYYGVAVNNIFQFPTSGGRRKLNTTRRNRRKNRKSKKQYHRRR